MQPGVFETRVDPEPAKKRRFRSSGGDQPSSNGGGGDGPDDYSNRNNFADDRSEPDQNPEKSRIITWFVLVIVLMTFGGLIGAYVVISTNNVLEWRPFNLPLAVWFSTAIILASSVVYHLGKLSVDREDAENTRKYFIATAALGGVFISSQLVAWISLMSSGLYVAGNPYAGFFYVLTAVHAVHVIGGIVALGAVLLRSWYETANEKEVAYRKALARSVGFYWHFMGALWIVLFVLLGFWK